MCLFCLTYLDEASLFQGDVRTVLSDGLEALCRDGEGNLFSDFRNKNSLLLKVYLAAALSCRIELSCTGTVRIPATYERSFTCDCTHS